MDEKTLIKNKKLLEFAARASGVEGTWSDCYQAILLISKSPLDLILWNPLYNDSDAFKLAIKLKLIINTNYKGGCLVSSAEGQIEEVFETDEVNPSAAIRLAIVRTSAIFASINKSSLV